MVTNYRKERGKKGKRGPNKGYTLPFDTVKTVGEMVGSRMDEIERYPESQQEEIERALIIRPFSWREIYMGLVGGPGITDRRAWQSRFDYWTEWGIISCISGNWKKKNSFYEVDFPIIIQSLINDKWVRKHAWGHMIEIMAYTQMLIDIGILEQHVLPERISIEDYIGDYVKKEEQVVLSVIQRT